MKPEEFRIGNYINAIHEVEIDRGNGIIEDCEVEILLRIRGIDEDSQLIDGSSTFSLEEISTDYQLEKYKNLEPIPLTEQWLLDFGFHETEKKDAHWISVGEYELHVSYNSLSGTLDKEPSWFCTIHTGHGSQPVTIVKMFVHDIQNLYFALTGKELTKTK